MQKSEKTQLGSLTFWTEYEAAAQEPNGSWSATALGKLRCQRDDGTAFTAETDTFRAYGRTAEQAQAGAQARAGKRLASLVGFIQEALGREPRP